VNRLREIVATSGPLILRHYANEIVDVVDAAKSLLSEDGAKEVLAHYVVLQILRDAIAALDKLTKETP
jgi:hypothetical protein